MTDTASANSSSRLSRWTTLWVILFSGIFVAIGLFLFSKRMSPSKRGSSLELFRILGTDLYPQSNEVFFDSGVAVIEDDTVVYSVQHLHGSDMKHVPLADTLEDFAKASDLLSEDLRSYADWTGPLPNRIRAFEIYFDATEPATAAGLESYLSAIERAQQEYWLAKDPSMIAYVSDDRANLRARWRHQRHIWANYVFEWCYLTCLIVCMAWPLFHKVGKQRLALHLGVAPLALMLPCYLGYATLSFTSMGPCGGILYPFVVLIGSSMTAEFCTFLNPINQIWYQNVPPILQVLSVPQGEPIVIGGRGLTGPAQATLIGLILAMMALLWDQLPAAKRMLIEKLNNRLPDGVDKSFAE